MGWRIALILALAIAYLLWCRRASQKKPVITIEPPRVSKQEEAESERDEKVERERESCSGGGCPGAS